MSVEPDPRSGIDPESGDWTPAFEGQRPPFEPGHELGGRPVEHGAYAVLALSPKALELAAELRAVYGGSEGDADELGRRVLAMCTLQLAASTSSVEQVTAAIERGDDVDVWLGRLEARGRLSKDSRQWAETVRKWADSLGYTPVGRAQLDAARLPPGIPPHEAQAFAYAVLSAALEFVDRARRKEFNERLDTIIGELPAAEKP
jgi:hypothetical protein